MKLKATFLSFILIFAVVFSSARSFMAVSDNCCRSSHCDTKEKKDKGCKEKENCSDFCCITIIALNTPQLSTYPQKQVLLFKNKIFATNDSGIINNGLPFFQPPELV